jgi:diaminohydroxyphosphoribosylaminopyrimidine deaminase/5-amino-6-(5-phosphoribosylamino)uracil reductase
VPAGQHAAWSGPRSVGPLPPGSPSSAAAPPGPAEYDAMRRALALGAEGLGATSPNPSVGAVVLDRDGRVAGEGRTAPVGGPHAEVRALDAAGGAARGGTAVVTLEPCDHVGRTGPCTAALIRAGVSRVLFGVADPDPVASGGGDTLRAAGVQVVGGVLGEQAAHGLRYWLAAVRRRRPYVVWKYAATLDGRVAAADGSSRWITAGPARRDVHDLRAGVDAIVAGVGTVLTDDPALTVRRDPTDPPRRPLRVVLDSAGRTPSGARVRDSSAPTWIVTSAERPGAAGRVDPAGVLDDLYARGVRAVLLEGGPTLAGVFLRAGLVDEVVGYLAPKLLGAGAAALGDAGVATIGAAIDLEIIDVTRLGPDLRVTAVPKGA